MRFWLSILFTISVLSCYSCRTSKSSFNASSVDAAPVIISMKKTACYGTCPVYEIQIYGDLTVTLKGERNIDRIGNFKSVIKKESLDRLVDRFREADFFSFEDEYTGNYTDLPTTYLFFSDQGKTKKIMDYYGAPSSLRELEEQVALLLQELDWEQVQDEG